MVLIYIYIKLATATVSEHISEGFNRMERVFFFFFWWHENYNFAK